MSELDLEKVRGPHVQSMSEVYPKRCACGYSWPCNSPEIQLADEVELGNSAISKQIEVNSGLRTEIAKLREAMNEAIQLAEEEDQDAGSRICRYVTSTLRAALPEESGGDEGGDVSELDLEKVRGPKRDCTLSRSRTYIYDAKKRDPLGDDILWLPVELWEEIVSLREQSIQLADEVERLRKFIDSDPEWSAKMDKRARGFEEENAKLREALGKIEKQVHMTKDWRGTEGERYNYMPIFRVKKIDEILRAALPKDKPSK